MPSFKPKTLPRRTLLAAGLAAPWVAHAAEPEFTWHLAHDAPRDSITQVRMLGAAGTVATKSGGRMSLLLHPAGERGSPLGLFEQLRNGKLDMALIGGYPLSSILTEFSLPMTGFAFAGYDELWPAMDGDLGAWLRRRMTIGLNMIALEHAWDFGFRQITTTGKTIRTGADMAGMTIRTVPEADFIGLFEALHADPVPTPLKLLTKAIATHVVEAQESILPLVSIMHLDRLMTTCALTNHIWDGLWVCVSPKSRKALPDEMFAIVANALNEAALVQRADTAAQMADIRKGLEAGGMTFNSVDRDSFREVLSKAGYYDKRRTRGGDDGWDVLEQYAGDF